MATGCRTMVGELPGPHTHPALPASPYCDFTWASACQLAELISSRQVSAAEVTEHFIVRIEALDPHLHAFRSTDFDGARRQACDIDAIIDRGESPGPLAGVPVALKEFLAAKDLVWQDLNLGKPSVAPRDGVEAERLRKAGAVIVGTTVSGLTAQEFGASQSQPHNPWDDDRVCGDSSSGAACAVASAMVPLAFTTDGLGSTRLPAAYCGLVGLLATRGRVPSTDWTQLTSRLIAGVGPMARDVRDAARGLNVIAGPDSRDFYCLPDPPPDYEAELANGTLGMRLCWTDDFGFADAYAGEDAATVIQAVRRAAFSLEAQLGLTIEEPDLAFTDPAWAGMKGLIGDPGLAVHQKLERDDVVRTREERARIAAQFERALCGRDFILSSTAQHIAPTRAQWASSWLDEKDGKPPNHMAVYSAHTAAANLIGWPAMSIPAGLANGMPVALQIIARPGDEKRMLQLAHALEAGLAGKD